MNAKNMIVLRYTPGPKNARGEAQATVWKPLMSFKGKFVPGVSNELNEALRTKLETHGTIYVTRSLPLNPKDHILVDGEKWEVIGNPAIFYSTMQPTKHTVIIVRRVVG